MPPATITSALPVARMSCASIAAFMPEPHILFTVVQPVPSGSPAPSEAWRAGACPWPAGSTQPMITSLTSSAPIFARSTAARIAAAPSSGAAKLFSSPWNAPIGVRAAETMTIGSGFMDGSFQILDCLIDFFAQTRNKLGRRHCTRERRCLTGPHRDEVRLACFRGRLAKLCGDAVLRRKGEMHTAFHFLHEAVGEAARRLAGEFFRDAGFVLARIQDHSLMDLGCPALRAGNERGAELRGLRAEREHRDDAGAVHDAARRDDRDLHRAHDHARER